MLHISNLPYSFKSDNKLLICNNYIVHTTLDTFMIPQKQLGRIRNGQHNQWL